MSVAVRRRALARVEGTVQGVGFRPYVYRLACELRLGGYVLNDAAGVLIEVEGGDAAVDAFFVRLAQEAPPLARIERITRNDVAPSAARNFEIRASPRGGLPAAAVTPDTAPCEDCLRELFDPADRRFRYPFINCTNCGPRFTIVRGIPYDRPFTTMAGFEMCAACRAEYDDPGNRRFHAQPNACPDCGPVLRLVGEAVAVDPLDTTVRLLREGAIVAIKGVGGFHLACRADDERAVAALRARKHREQKPFALMARTLAQARELVEATADDKRLLVSRERPIVLVPRRPDAPVAPAVAPRSTDLGVMLPYSPLHHLLLAEVEMPLVMTSGNLSNEPIAYRDEEALERLASIADAFLLHDRPIQTRTDDSVLRTVAVGERRRPMFQRRSRGYVPEALQLPIPAEPPLLACGAELKNTFCVASGSRAWVSHHVGDLENWETLQSFTEGIAHFERLYEVRPTVIAHDLHPDYLSTKYALERDGARLVGVQHHHAHLAACLAEHGLEGPAVGAIFDGTGYGSDGTIWGGEILVGGLESFERTGHLWPVRMPGGQAAIREPWRIACAWLLEAGWPVPPDWAPVAAVARSGIASPITSSVGRLFDAISALAGICTAVDYEGQAAIELEAACDPAETGGYELPLVETPDGVVLDARPLVAAAAGDLGRGAAPARVAARFHNGLADATAAACALVARRAQCGTAVLAGGTWQNRRLLERAAAALDREGLRVLIPERLPPGDGAVAFGQAAVATAQLASGAA